MNGHKTVIVDDRCTVTTTVERQMVTLRLSRAEVSTIVAGLSMLSANQAEHLQNRARELLWKVVDETAGPTRTIDRRVGPARLPVESEDRPVSGLSETREETEEGTR